ncbi:isopeptide-forming domain-containing fimbrial protein [Leifsonia sp. YAF41]|uniref:isopeptide-forming domain-containing fimbrial protein n=1 Tax=Leifsonia sp. YAF41 TaxID=3233086 RepID=UPI003F9DAA7E
MPIHTAVHSRRTARHALAGGGVFSPGRLHNRLIAGLVASVLVAAGLVVGAVVAPSASAATVPTVTVDSPAVLAGEDVVFGIELNHPEPAPGDPSQAWYNMGVTVLVPNGVSLVSPGSLGDPMIYPSGATPPNSAAAATPVPAGFQLWVFEDIADLPIGATFAGNITVRPVAATFPVGSQVEITSTVFASTDPTLKPIFDGSTGAGAAAGLAATVRGASLKAAADIRAARITKSEPSPEAELLRGVHDNGTVYTLTVENSGEGETTGVELVDYLPAGLEFLGCGLGDNTLPSAHLFDDHTREYPGANPLNTPAAPVSDCAPGSYTVDTVTLPNGEQGTSGLAAGVYTKVVWNLTALPQGTPQPGDQSAAGTPSTTTISYRAGIPLFENALWPDGTAPDVATGEQAANLGNNTGAPTRQGVGAAAAADGTTYLNRAVLSGNYEGPVASEADRAVSEHADESVMAMDLRILKSVSTGATDSDGNPEDDRFVTNGLATFTLDLRTSEYTSADTIVATDTLPNGLCPAFPVEPEKLSGDPLPAECDFGTTEPGAVLTGATVTELNYAKATGEFTVTFAATVAQLAENTTHQIVYTALMRPNYDLGNAASGSTSSGDSLTNTVTVTGITTAKPALTGVTNPAGVPADGTELVWDDSEATLISDFSTISKKVLPRNDVLKNAAPGNDPCASSGYVDGRATVPGGFVLGDTVCYELTVDFASSIDVRNPLITDFLPKSVTYSGSAIDESLSKIIDSSMVPAPTVAGQRIDWKPGTLSDGARFVPRDSVLVLHVWGIVAAPSASAEKLDKPENLMKYQQENVKGDVSFLRDGAKIEVVAGAALTKGVASVNGNSTRAATSQTLPDGNAFDSNRDGVQVEQGETVRYRIDVTAPPFPVTDLVVWDALPAGITCAAVATASLAPGVCTDAYPGLTAPEAGRSAIVWEGLGMAADEKRTLSYSVTVPAGTEVNTTHTNTASIISYTTELNTGQSKTFFPDGSLDTTTRPVESVVPGMLTRDDSAVYLAKAVIAKTLVSTEHVDVNNSSTEAVQGERITYDYSVTVPAHTTVKNGVLQDLGKLGATVPDTAYTLTAASWTQPGGAVGAFTFDSTTGKLTFPASYTNSTASGQTFTVRITVYMAADRWDDKTTLHNQATFSSDSWNGAATADVIYREPAPAIVKTVDQSTDVTAGANLTYTLTVTNPTGRPTSYETVVTDCVPAKLENVRNFLPSQGTVTTDGTCAGGGLKLLWNVGQVAANASITLQYTVTVSNTAVGSAAYDNTADLVGYTLPSLVGGVSTVNRRGERTDDSTATVTIKGATLDKTVSPKLAPIGDIVTYTVNVELPARVNFFDASVIDTLPAGLTLTGTPTVSCTIPDGTPCAAPTGATPLTGVGQKIGWTMGDIVASNDIRTVTITYSAKLTNSTTTPVVAKPTNTAHVAWNKTDPGVTVTVDGPFDTTTTDVSAPVTVLNPVVTVAKTVSNSTPKPGETFTYSVTASNSGNTPAHNITIVDAVPTGVVVAPATISNGGVLTGNTTTGGGTITWTLAGPLNVGTPVVLNYQAQLAASETLTAASLTNSVRATRYESFATDGRVYGPSGPATAVVTPAFPHIALAKTTVGTDVAYANTPFGWKLTAKNTGTGAAQKVTLTDTLPANWSYDVDSALVSVNGATAVPIEPANPASSTLTWALGSPAADPTLLPAGASIVITFTATPNEDAAVTAEDGTPFDHVNTLSAVTTDPTGATGNLTGGFTGPDKTADANIHSADVKVVKTAAADLVAGTSGTGWTLTVSNAGPDAAVGPITVVDVPAALPNGVTVTAVAGTGWTCTAPSPGFSCVSAAASLASGASLEPILVTVAVAASVAPTTVDNTATVSATTFDPDLSNNESSDELAIVTQADLSVVKTLITTDPGAGSPITWHVVPNNLGPSVSRADITITDVVPAGIVGVNATSADWECDTDEDNLAGAGDTITCTYTANGGIMPIGIGTAVELTGTIASSYTGGAIENMATIVPGATTDPEPDNNESTTVDSGVPLSATVIAVEKTLVSPLPVIIPGDNAVYSITVTNQGPADARAVTITDVLPTGLTFVSAESKTGTWTCDGTTTASTVDCELTGTLSAAAGSNTAVVEITVATASNLTGTIVNGVTASAENAPDDYDDTSSDPLGKADLSITKSHRTGAVLAGTSLDYTLTVTNNGPSDSPETIEVVDTVPVGLVPTSAVGDDWACVIGSVTDGQPTTVTCELDGALAAQATAEPITVTVSVPATLAAQTLVNTASVDGPLVDPTPGNNTANDPTVITTKAAVSIIKDVASAAPFVAGNSVDYTVTVTNTGPSVANAVRVADVVPTGMTLTAISGTDWTCAVATAECTRAVLPLGAFVLSIIATIDQAVAEGSTLTNHANLSWTDSDGTHTGTDPADISVTALADLALVKTAVDAAGNPVTTAVAGAEGRYLLQATNQGPSAAVAPLRIVDQLPVGISYVGLVDSGDWVCAAAAVDANGQSVDCTWAGTSVLAAGAAAHPLTLVITYDSALPVGDLTNTADVSSPTTDPKPEDNPSDSTVTIDQLTDLSITKTHSGPVRIGDAVAFDLGVKNAGPSVASGITVTDTLPVGLEFVDALGSDPAWSCVTAVATDAGTAVTCVLTGDLAPGATAPALVINARVLPGAYPSVVNVASVASTTPESDPTNNSADDTVAVPAQASLTVTKASVGTFTVGQKGSYTLTVTNAGPTEDPGPITLTDKLPAGLTFASANGQNADCAEASQIVTCTLDGALGVGKSRTVTLVVTVQQAAYPSVTNVVQVTSPTEQLPEAQLTDSDTTSVAAAPPLASSGFNGIWSLLIALLVLLLGGGMLVVRRRVA